MDRYDDDSDGFLNDGYLGSAGEEADLSFDEFVNGLASRADES